MASAERAAWGRHERARRPQQPKAEQTMSHKVSDPVEPVVICDELIHDAIQLPDDEGAVDPGPAKEEMTPDRFHEVTFLSFSYKGTPRSCCVCAS